MGRPKKEKRIWKVQLNIDSLNAVSMGLPTDEACAQAWRGLCLGVNGYPLPADAPASMVMGFEIGAASHAEALGFMERQSNNGKQSAQSRRKRYGTAQPSSAGWPVPGDDPDDIPTGQDVEESF